MNLKGTAVISLKNEKTGEVKTLTENNLITNAIYKLFNNNIEGMLFNIGGSTTDLSNNYVPICPNSIGGILLFSDALNEDENLLYAPSENPCIGYASNDVNATANVMRGSLNLTESGKIDNGYKFVWDFTTSQANGTITAVALTHKFGGVGYLGDLYNSTSNLLEMKNVGSTLNGIKAGYYVDACEVNFDGNYFYSISINNANEIIINKIRKCFRQVGLKFSMREDGDELLLTQTLIPETFISPNSGSQYADFHDGEDGYWYGFLAPSNSSGNAMVKWIKIKKSDYSFSEGSWTLNNAQIYQVGYRYSYGSYPSRNVQSIMRNGYIYFMSYSRTGIYKINANNQADIILIPFGFTSNFSGGDNYGYTQIYKIGDAVIGSDFILTADDTVIHTNNSNPLNYICTPLFISAPYALAFGRYQYNTMTIYKHLFLVSPYLASINNLSESIIKTADKTMKITYTVTEE